MIVKRSPSTFELIWPSSCTGTCEKGSSEVLISKQNFQEGLMKLHELTSWNASHPRETQLILAPAKNNILPFQRTRDAERMRWLTRCSSLKYLLVPGRKWWGKLKKRARSGHVSARKCTRPSPCTQTGSYAIYRRIFRAPSLDDLWTSREEERERKKKKKEENDPNRGNSRGRKAAERNRLFPQQPGTWGRRGKPGTPLNRLPSRALLSPVQPRRSRGTCGPAIRGRSKKKKKKNQSNAWQTIRTPGHSKEKSRRFPKKKGRKENMNEQNRTIVSSIIATRASRERGNSNFKKRRTEKIHNDL